MLQLASAVRAPSAAAPAEQLSGFAAALDELSASGEPARLFLRGAWYEAGGGDGAATLVGRRGDGTPFAALPLARTGRLPLRSVPGNYWPFRSFPVACDAGEEELASLFASKAARRLLAPAWRLGPVYDEDPAARLAKAAMLRAGWTVLTRRLGRSWTLDVEALRATGRWPRKSTLSRARNYEKQLAALAPLEWRQLGADDWDETILDDLGRIEANSWVGRSTDGSGAKFMRPGQRLYWKRAARDPLLAEALTVLILYVGGRPAAFSFDLVCGDHVYGIASSYDQDFARFRAGKIVTWRGIEQAIAAGVRRIDWGAGDSGYKKEAGAEAAENIVDLLFVQNRGLAALLRPRWELPEPDGKARDVATVDGFGVVEHALMGAILASAAVASME